MWSAKTANKIPTYYGIVVKRGKDLWQLDRSRFDLEATFNDDDALKQRICDTLQYAHDKSFFEHQRAPLNQKEAGQNAIYSTTALPNLPDWTTFKIERRTDASVETVEVTCETRTGELRALLDRNKEIQDVTVNGKRSDDWMSALVQANKLRAKMYDE